MNWNQNNDFRLDRNGGIQSVKLKGNDISMCLKIDIENPDELAGKLWHRRITGSKIFNIDKLKIFKSNGIHLQN